MPRPNEVKQLPRDVIVIHPGSWFIRIGHADQFEPIIELNAIARIKSYGALTYSDSFLPKRSSGRNVQDEIKYVTGIQKAFDILQASNTSIGEQRTVTPQTSIIEFNRNARTVEYHLSYRPQNDVVFQQEHYRLLFEAERRLIPDEDYYVGNELLQMSSFDNYNVHFPYSRGDFNIHGFVGGSATSVIHDLEHIIDRIIRTRLAIRRDLFDRYRVAFLIPDIFRRTHIKMLGDLLLNKLNFKSCVFIQESVCGAYGTGFTTGVVVDLGDQTTSVSCIDEGTSIPDARIRLNFGSADLAQIFHSLLEERSFPYALHPKKLYDSCFIRQLMNDWCHLNLDVCDSLEKSFLVSKAIDQQTRYTVRLGDESIVAPFALFYPSLFILTGPKLAIGQRELQFEPEDPIDENFLRDVSKPRNKDMAVIYETNNLNSDHVIVGEGTSFELDRAILHSINRLQNDEMKKKMLSNIILVGGNSEIPDLKNWILKKLQNQTSNLIDPESISVTVSNKKSKGVWVEWRGGAIASGMDSVQELFVTKDDYQKYGAKVLRDKSLFAW